MARPIRSLLKPSSFKFIFLNIFYRDTRSDNSFLTIFARCILLNLLTSCFYFLKFTFFQRPLSSTVFHGIRESSTFFTFGTNLYTFHVRGSNKSVCGKRATFTAVLCRESPRLRAIKPADKPRLVPHSIFHDNSLFIRMQKERSLRERRFSGNWEESDSPARTIIPIIAQLSSRLISQSFYTTLIIGVLSALRTRDFIEITNYRRYYQMESLELIMTRSDSDKSR